jgi:hypothetical protein
MNVQVTLTDPGLYQALISHLKCSGKMFMTDCSKEDTIEIWCSCSMLETGHNELLAKISRPPEMSNQHFDVNDPSKPWNKGRKKNEFK